MMLRFARWHIWLGWVVGLPILMWTVTGLVMVARPIEEVRGSALQAPAVPVAPGAYTLPEMDEPIHHAELIQQPIGPVWLVTTTDGGRYRYYAPDGSLVPPVIESEAREIAEASFAGEAELESLTYFPADAPPVDLRRAVNAWQASFADGTNLYIDAATGEVLAVVGNRRADEPGFNRALEAQRPVGSLLKPFVYLLALAQPDRYSLASWVQDTPVEVTLSSGKPWRPKNSDGRSHGTVTLGAALARSLNQATVRVGMQVGPDRLADLMKALGGVKPPPNPSLILGSVDLSVLSMAQMYQFLASGGRIQPLRAVRGVLDPDGKPLNRYDTKAEPAQEGDAIAARLVTLALQGAVTSGTARPLLADGLGPMQPAGKTGTSNDSRDSWFAGYTGDRLAVVWVGNDQNQPTGLYGATGAMRVWSGLFSKLPGETLRVPGNGIEWAWLDANEYATTEEGCPGARRAAFVSGYLPPEHKSCRQGSWLDWFHLGGEGPPPAEPAPPAQEPR